MLAMQKSPLIKAILVFKEEPSPKKENVEGSTTHVRTVRNYNNNIGKKVVGQQKQKGNQQQQREKKQQ